MNIQPGFYWLQRDTGPDIVEVRETGVYEIGDESPWPIRAVNDMELVGPIPMPGAVDLNDRLGLAMREYEFAAYEHGKTGENALAVDAAGHKLRALYTITNPPQPNVAALIGFAKYARGLFRALYGDDAESVTLAEQALAGVSEVGPVAWMANYGIDARCKTAYTKEEDAKGAIRFEEGGYVTPLYAHPPLTSGSANAAVHETKTGLSPELDWVVRLAEDFAEACIKAGYVTTSSKEWTDMVETLRTTVPPGTVVPRVTMLPAKRFPEDYAEGTYGPEDLAAIWNAAVSETKRLNHPDENDFDARGPWTSWTGGKQPVADNVVVEYRTKGGSTLVMRSHHLDWSWLEDRPNAGDIIAYRKRPDLKPED